MFCRNCGAENESGAVMCSNCGFVFEYDEETQDKQVQPEGEEQAYDTNAAYDPNAYYDPNAAYDPNAYYEQPVYDEQAAAGGETADEVIAAGQPDSEAEEPSAKQSQLDEIKKRRDKKRKQKKLRKVILIVLLVALCSGAVGAALYFSQKQDDKINGDNLKTAEATKKVTKTETIAPKKTSLPLALPNINLTDEPIEMLEINPSPSATPSPGATQRTTTTQKATQTQKSNTTQGGRTTVTPRPAATPKTATPKPSTTKRPTSTQKTTSTQKPVATQKPAPVSTPAPTPVPTPVPTPKPVVRDEINTSLVTVSWSVTDESGNSYAVATTRAGKTIYIQGMSGENNSYSVVSAVDSGYKIDGIPVYNATSSVAINKNEFIIPDSEFKLLTEADIAGMSAEQLRLARNEIYARHGRTFKDNSLNEYFKTKSWYGPNGAYNYSDDAANITETENKNAHFLLEAEKALLGQ